LSTVWVAVVPLEISEVGANPVGRYPVGRCVGLVEQPPAIQPLQPPAIAIDDPAVCIFGVFGPRTTFFEQVAGNQGGLPQAPIDLRPFLERLATPVRILMKEPGHRTAAFLRSFSIVSSK